jgi:hypothetical protein
VTPVDRVDGVVYRARDHRHAAALSVRGRPEGNRVLLGDLIPVRDHVGSADRRRRERGCEDGAREEHAPGGTAHWATFRSDAPRSVAAPVESM